LKEGERERESERKKKCRNFPDGDAEVFFFPSKLSLLLSPFPLPPKTPPPPPNITMLFTFKSSALGKDEGLVLVAAALNVFMWVLSGRGKSRGKSLELFRMARSANLKSLSNVARGGLERAFIVQSTCIVAIKMNS